MTNDATPYGLVIGNDTFSTTDTDGLAAYVSNTGGSFIDARGTGATMSLATAGVGVSDWQITAQW